jgi:hypothetical protein
MKTNGTDPIVYGLSAIWLANNLMIGSKSHFDKRTTRALASELILSLASPWKLFDIGKLKIYVSTYSKHGELKNLLLALSLIVPCKTAI